MKREFLQEFKVEGQPLPKDVIDAIMAENGRDIQKARAAFADHEELKTRLAQAEERLQQADAQQEWKEKYDTAVAEHAQSLRQLQFDHLLERKIDALRGRSQKAIMALLDLDALKESEDPQGAVNQALDVLREEHGYLFAPADVPAYAPATGAYTAQHNKAPASLAGALREKFERK